MENKHKKIYLAFNPHALTHGSPHFLFIQANKPEQSELTKHSGRQFGGAVLHEKYFINFGFMVLLSKHKEFVKIC